LWSEVIADCRLPIADLHLAIREQWQRQTNLTQEHWREAENVNHAKDQSAIGNDMRHTLSIVVADQPGELSRIVGLFSARGFNIETLSVGQTTDPQWSRVTVVTRGDDRTIEQIVKQCSRLARVREVLDVTMQPHIEREMALIDVEATPGTRRQEVVSLVAVFRAKVVDISHTGMIIEATGNKEKVEAFIELLRPMGIRDITRTGCIAIGRLSNIDSSRPATEEPELSQAVSTS